MKAAVLLLAAAAALKAPDPVTFPGAAEAKDPNGRYRVVFVVPPAGQNAKLALEDSKTGISTPLLTIGRAATVFWSPDGGALAVTDRKSASSSTVLLATPGQPGLTDLAAVLARTLGPLPEQTGNRNVHLEVVRWLDARKLRVRLRGFGERDPGGFDELFDYELSGRFRRAAF
ncbi:MAG TPA: hypothetical protein VMH79_11970 [Thermoanaerobaculia bacterium]|nr:hypothetical protein [Thermoanaerobaculia bacterium]